MKLGVVGLPNVGKSTLFNAITNAGAECANYPFCTIEPNVGIVAVPDERLATLGKLYNTRKITPAVLEFVDIAGLVKGASAGEGLGNKFLAHIREVDAIVHVVRCFEDDNITHVENDIDPLRDIETIDLELIFADLDTVKKRKDKAEKLLKVGDKKYHEEYELLTKIEKALEAGQPARSLPFGAEERALAKEFFLLTAKPVIYCANIAEKDIGQSNPHADKVAALAAKEGATAITVCAKVEAELTQLNEEDRKLFIDELGISESGLSRMVKAGYGILGLISYLTAGEKEVRAWTIAKGTKAPQAAGKIHSDFERGFIRAEVAAYEDIVRYGGYLQAKEKGKVRSEGKDYIVQDGDVVLFRFNV